MNSSWAQRSAIKLEATFDELLVSINSKLLKLGLIGLDVENLLPVDGSAAADVHRESVAVVWPAMGQGSLAKAGRMKRKNRGAVQCSLIGWRISDSGNTQHFAMTTSAFLSRPILRINI